MKSQQYDYLNQDQKNDTYWYDKMDGKISLCPNPRQRATCDQQLQRGKISESSN